MWNRRDVDYVVTQDLPWAHVPGGEFGADHGGGMRKTLSVDLGDQARTDLVSFTNPQRGLLTSPCDFYVLQGSGRLNGEPYAPGTYVHVTADSVVDWSPAAGRTVLYAGHHGAATFEPGEGAGRVTIKHETRDEWVSMGWRGDEPQPADVKIRWLRQDDAGIALLVGMLPGYTAPMEEVHPVYEESFKIAGDLMMGRRGIVKAGGYFFRSPGTWHGPLYSRTGNLSLIRKNGFGSTDYREPQDGDLAQLVPALYSQDASMVPCLQRAWS